MGSTLGRNLLHTFCHKSILSINRQAHYSSPVDLPLCVGATKDLVELVQGGSESPSAAGAAHVLAVFTTGKNASTYRASVQAAGGVPALLTWVHQQDISNSLSDLQPVA